jgi:RNA polymerase sigma-70 factor (sigma-E family)
MRAAEEDHYRQFVQARLGALRHTAYVLCRDWYLADDLVSITITKLYRHWPRVRGVEHLDAYVRGMLTNAWLDERRRPWRRESAVDELPERVYLDHPSPDRPGLLRLLGTLPPRQRAVVVLRFYCDLSITDTARALEISEGTVKSLGSRGLAALRVVLTDEFVPQEMP